MKTTASQESSDPHAENPIHDSLRQEIVYKLDERYSGCLLTALALGLLATATIAFLAYWLTRI